MKKAKEEKLTSRQEYIKREKEATLRLLHKEINEENMKNVTICTVWETIR